MVTKLRIGVNDFPAERYERLLSDHQAIFPLRCGNFVLTAAVDTTKLFRKLRREEMTAKEKTKTRNNCTCIIPVPRKLLCSLFAIFY